MIVKLSRILFWNQIAPYHRPLLGEKCYKLAQYKQIGLPVPPFFAIPNVEVAKIIEKGKISFVLEKEISKGVKLLEEETKCKFGDPKDPLVLVVRSGDPQSLYGSLLSIPSVGLNHETCQGLINKYGKFYEKEVLWLYLNLIVDFAIHVEGAEREKMGSLFKLMKEEEKSTSELGDLLSRALSSFPFPQNVYDQLNASIKAVASSWKLPRARYAAFSLGLDPDDVRNFPSVFVQQMKFTLLGEKSGFLSLLSHPQSGIYAPMTSGRRVMVGAAKNVFSLDFFKKVIEPELYRQIIEKLVHPVVREEKEPVSMEIAIEEGKPYLIQAGPAMLSPMEYVKAVNELEREGIINEAEAARKRKAVQQVKVSTYKINPNVNLKLLGKGQPGVSGAMVGRLATSLEAVLRFKKKGERVILFSDKPDEDVYRLVLSKKVEGVVLTFGAGKTSHLVSFAEAHAIPLAVSLHSAKIFPEKVELAENVLKVGEWLVIDGGKGEIFSVNKREKERALVKDEEVAALAQGINYVELLRSVRSRYQNYDYDDLVSLHGEKVKELNQKRGEISKEEVAEIEALIHGLHLLAYEKGKERYGENFRLKVDLDVAVADGNLNRIQGLEDKNFFIQKEDNERYSLITATEIYYDFDQYLTGGFSDTGSLVEAGKKQGLDINQFFSRRKLTIHTQEVFCYGITFPRKQLEAVVEFLIKFFQNG